MKLLAIALTGALAAGAAFAAETDDLASQSRRMDSLATSQGTPKVESRISGDFATFAGSPENSGALVTGLRNGTSVTLTSTSTDAKGVVTVTETTFTPLTGKMGYGNVYTSLALAKHQLAQMGITNPTATQLQAALNGGTILVNGKEVPVTGVLELRAQGMGWGQIAQQYGTKLGPVISGMKSANAQVASQPAVTTSKTTGVTTAAGGAVGQGHGQGNAHGRGITTAGGGAAGPASSHGQGNAYGRGIVTGAGASSGNAGNAAGKGKGN